MSTQRPRMSVRICVYQAMYISAVFGRDAYPFISWSDRAIYIMRALLASIKLLLSINEFNKSIPHNQMLDTKISSGQSLHVIMKLKLCHSSFCSVSGSL